MCVYVQHMFNHMNIFMHQVPFLKMNIYKINNASLIRKTKINVIIHFLRCH